MKRRGSATPGPGSNDVEEALAALGAEELREAVREILLELDERTHGRTVNSLIDRAARSGSGWAPAALDDEEVAEVLAFAEAAERVGQADPSEVDEHLRRGSVAFLRKDYAAARSMFGALLRPIGEGDIFLGQDEMVDEVLGVEPGDCAAQYVVSTYMTGAPQQRAEVVRAAIEEVQSLGHFWEPIREMERVAVEPLPGLQEFLPRWRSLVEREVGGKQRGSDWDSDQHRWLREVVQRMEGSAGLAKVARSTKRADDLRAWCRSLVEAGDWKAALAAFEEAAGLVADKEYTRGEFLDGAALAAQALGRSDLPARLERAWRAAPSMLRLRRWLGCAGNKTAVTRRATAALDACPKKAHRQRALLHVLLGAFEPAAKLLAGAPGLGWSDGEHPGHLLFPVFEALLGGERVRALARGPLPTHDGMDLEKLELMTADEDEPRLAAPEVDHILRQAGISGLPTTRPGRLCWTPCARPPSTVWPGSPSTSGVATTATPPSSSRPASPVTDRPRGPGGPIRSGPSTGAFLRFVPRLIAQDDVHERQKREIVLRESEFLLYSAPDGAVKVRVLYKDETVWLTQRALADLLGMKVPAIAKHLKNTFDSGELSREATVSKMEVVQARRRPRGRAPGGLLQPRRDHRRRLSGEQPPGHPVLHLGDQDPARVHRRLEGKEARKTPSPGKKDKR